MNEDSYFKFWVKCLGYDIQIKATRRTLTKGEFYRSFTTIAESLTLGDPLPERFELIKRLPFVPFVSRDGVLKKEKSIVNNN